MRRDDDTVARWAYDRAIRERDELIAWIEEVRAKGIEEWPDPGRWSETQVMLLGSFNLPPHVSTVPGGYHEDEDGAEQVPVRAQESDGE